MAMCNKEYASLGREGFYEHVRHEVSVIADNVADKIKDAIYGDAHSYKVQDDGSMEGVRQEWKENLGIDIAQINTESSGSHDDQLILDNIRGDITDYVHERLKILEDRAQSLPSPSEAATLSSSIRRRLYGMDYADGENPAQGVLGEAQENCAIITTDYLTSWQSGAGEVYKDSLKNLDEVVISNHRIELNTLAHLAELNHGVIYTAREDICRIVHGAAVAAEDMDDGCGDGTDGTPNDAEGTGAFVGLGVALAALAAACAPAAPIGWGIAVATAGAGNASIPFFDEELDDPPQKDSAEGKDARSFSAANWKELIDKIAEAANQMSEDLDSCYAKISEKANDRIRKIDANRNDSYVANSGT